MIKLLDKEYRLPRFSKKTFRKLQEMGVPSLTEHPYHFVTGVVALAANITFDEATNLLYQHVQNGGDICAIIDQISENVESFTDQAMRRSNKARKKLQKVINGWWVNGS